MTEETGTAVSPCAPPPPPGDDAASARADRSGRLDWLDVARGIALLAMAVYHLSWDLSWFALVDWPVDRGAGWRGFAAAIAGSFLFLVGVGLVLSHRRGIRWKAALLRAGRIALAAGAISLATWYALGDQYVRFGILHAIAAGSLITLPFVFVPAPLTLLAAAGALALPRVLSLSFAGDDWFGWTGLVATSSPSVDHVPLFPWLAPILAGIAIARLTLSTPAWARLGTWRARGIGTRLTAFFGRHSLAFYLLHQPLLYGAVWAAVSLGVAPDPAETAFLEQCEMSCAILEPGEAEAEGNVPPPDCAEICRCTLDTLSSEGSWVRLLEHSEDPTLNSAISNAYGQCTRATTLSDD
jgi:uncharacterized membrane protein